MFPVFHFNENELLAFALVMIRISAFITTWPVFSVYSTPNVAKILLSLIIAMLMFPTISRAELSTSDFGDEIIWLTVKEAFVGVCMGFMARFFFFAVAMGGNLISTYMGVSSAQLYNPQLSMQATVVEQFYLSMVTLVFLGLNGHHIFLDGLAKSFQLVPLSMKGGEFAVFKEVTTFFQDALIIAIQVSAPIMAAVFIMNVFMGVLGRAVPQINVLVTSLPVNIMVGLFVMIVTIPVMVPETEGMMNSMALHIFKFLKAF